ncbi:hypothetical protein ACKS0A_05373 [Histoplasma ohiense]
MIDHTPFWFIFIMTCIIILRSVAPLSVAYSAILILLPHCSYRLPSLLEYWAIAEALFYLAFYFYRTYHLQRPAVHPPLPPIEKRRELFERCLRNIPDYERYISKWFLGVPLDNIKRENVKDFFCWAFLNTATAGSAQDDEIEEYVRKLEEAIGREFQPGRSNAKCLRLTIDNATILHRSLVWYLCVLVVDAVTYSYMLLHKFRFHRPSFTHAFSIFPPRPQALIGANKSHAKRLTYWYRPHTSCNKLPILFLHGIGIGLYPYVNFLAELNQQDVDGDGEVGIIAVEILHISFRIAGGALTKDEFCMQLWTVLQSHGFDEFVLVSHSYGSVITTHLLHSLEFSNRITSVIMVDPVSILLHLPDVAYNFMIRKPKLANEWQLWYFASKDAGVAHTISRHFFWSENILWKEDIAHYRSTIFLSDRDLLVDASQVYMYLLGPESDHKTSNLNCMGAKNAAESNETQQLNVVWCTNLDHGQIFESKQWREQLVTEVLSHIARHGNRDTKN